MNSLKFYGFWIFFLILVYLLLAHPTTEGDLQTAGGIGINGIKALQGR